MGQALAADRGVEIHCWRDPRLILNAILWAADVLYPCITRPRLPSTDVLWRDGWSSASPGSGVL